MNFVHLHCHSSHSLLDGLGNPGEFVEAAVEKKMSALALTDHGSCSSALEFYKAAKDKGIIPIVGTEFYVADDPAYRPKKKNERPPRYHLTVLAKNWEGLKSIFKQLSVANSQFYYKPVLSVEQCLDFKECVIMTACAVGVLSHPGYYGLMERFKAAYGDDLYVEIMPHWMEMQKIVNERAVKVSELYSIKPVATNDCHYPTVEDTLAHDMLLAIQTNRKPGDKKIFSFIEGDEPLDGLYLKDTGEMLHSFMPWVKQGIMDFDFLKTAFASTVEIAKKCSGLEIPKLDFTLPSIPVLRDKKVAPADEMKFLIEKIQEGWKRLKPSSASFKAYQKRLQHELKVISKIGAVRYFLIVWDIIREAKAQDILCGFGRGCVLPDTEVLMADGTITPIIDVCKGDRVVTHTGNNAFVTKTMSYDCEETIVELTAGTDFIRLTRNHKVYAIRSVPCYKHKTFKSEAAKRKAPRFCRPVYGCKNTYGCTRRFFLDYQPEWVETKDLKEGDYICYPRVFSKKKDIVFDMLDHLEPCKALRHDESNVWYERGSNGLETARIPRFISFNESFARLLGYYIAEGWAKIIEGKSYELGFGFHSDETSYVSEVFELISNIFGLEPSVRPRKTRKCVQITIKSKALCQFFRSLVENGARNKRIPAIIMHNGNDEYVKAMLGCMLRGDGNKEKGKYPRIKYSTISRNLASQVKMLLARFGYFASIGRRTKKPANWDIEYSVRVSGEQLHKWNSDFKLFTHTRPDMEYSNNWVFAKYEDSFFVRIRKIQMLPYKGRVYDLMVPGDTSYVGNYLAIHNSAGGSLVAYLLGIVGLDPLAYELYFERFLREDRIDMPDIDLDFAGKDRDKIIEYIRNSYGEQNVSHISTSSFMHGKTAFRDVARVFGVEYPKINELSKRIDNDLSLAENFENDPLLMEFKTLNPDIVRFATRLDGQLRSKGLHAGGVIISEDGFNERGVLEYRQKATTINWNMDEVENFGLLKVDILGLNNLSVLNDISRLVRERTGKGIDYFKIVPNEPEVLKQFSDGYTAGFFQFESNGITGLCKRLAPIENFETLIHINALYRPGPLESGMVDSYVRRYRKEEGVAYNHPNETEITAKTLGLPIYQENIMAYFVKLAGFSWPEADNMRKIIAKSKGVEKLEEKRPEFLKGCFETSGISEDTANIIYDQIVKFGKYGFNRSHAADYSLIAYLTAWAKYYYPVEFMCSLLRSVTDEAEQTAKYVKEVRRLGIKLLPPEINISNDTFSVVENDILVGFSSVKGVGPTAARKIQQARHKKGRFENFNDFLEKTDRRTVNKRVVTALAKAGAFRSICQNTKWIIDCYDALMKGGKALDGLPSPEGYRDFDNRTKESFRIETIPGVFSGDDIEVTARIEIDKPVLEMLQEQIRECDQCELYNPKGTGPTPFHFSRDNRILLVSQKIDQKEQAAGRPGVGKMWTKLEEIFQEHLGLSPGKFMKASMFQCRPPCDKLSKEVMEKSACAKIWLDKLIKTAKPEVIFAMGSAAHRFFTGKTSGINNANGNTLWLPKYQALVLFAIHPGQMYFDSTGEKEEMFLAAVDKLKEYL